jgi:DNA topoisomerase-2
MPLLDEIGQFGSMRSPDAGAPRYISTKLNESFKLLYKDFELLEKRYEEGIEIEPFYFLPIIPTVLLNGGSGIAVGFASNILNRNPLDLIDACLKELNGKKYKEPKPWYYGFTGHCERDPDSKDAWIFNGTFEVKNTSTVHITELPPSLTYEKYEKYLVNNEDSKKITGFDDNSKSNIDYTIKFRRTDLSKLIHSDRLCKFLKLEERQSENLTMLDENGKLKIFNNVKEVISYFIKFRLEFYYKRKDFLIKKLNGELKILSNKARFIEMIVEGKLKINNVPKNKIIASLEDGAFDKINDSYSYLLSMPIHTLTKEKYEELLHQQHNKEVELEKIKKMDPKEMYINDLKELKVLIKKNYAK